MTPDVRAHSFDRPRERWAPGSFSGRDGDGRLFTRSFDRFTLVVAVKPSCDGCREFVQSSLDELQSVDLVVISQLPDETGEWRGSAQPVVVAPELWATLDIRSAPFYVLVDPQRERVVTEGVVFAPSQVADEIAEHLRR